MQSSKNVKQEKHKKGIAKNLGSSKEQQDEFVRLHVQLRKDLELKMLSLIYHVKIDPAKKERLTKKAKVTKRTIVEEALEEYFEKRGI